MASLLADVHTAEHARHASKTHPLYQRDIPVVLNLTMNVLTS